jgi:hypothetical protein
VDTLVFEFMGFAMLALCVVVLAVPSQRPPARRIRDYHFQPSVLNRPGPPVRPAAPVLAISPHLTEMQGSNSPQDA